MAYQRKNLTFNWDSTNRQINNLMFKGQNLLGYARLLLQSQDSNQGHPFSIQRRFFVTSEIEELCEEVFSSVKEVKLQDNDDIMAAYLATSLFNYLAEYWEDKLLKNGLYLTGVSFWQEIISITKVWESKNSPHLIHKGTPFFFLAYNCLLNGDRENGFTYLYNAIEDDKKLGIPNYPKDGAAYLTATMSDKPQNYAYPFVRDLRLLLSQYFIKFNLDFSPRFTMANFEGKFLENVDLSDVVYFFVYNFQFVYDLSHNTNYDLLQNDFSRLKILDLFFNFGLIIDEVLKYSASRVQHIGSGMKDYVSWWAENKMGFPIQQFDNLIGTNGLNLNATSPDNIIPYLLTNVQNPSNGIKKEVYAMLIAYKLRNHAGHNLDQQMVVTTKYDEILNCMFYSLFLALQSF
ncbi:MAG TPA: hypothetical protein VJR22_08300 [Candidatus Nitrosotalea sp.]|nr:hypothetical protein [Candidatus Nitrosotalea sp.]